MRCPIRSGLTERNRCVLRFWKPEGLTQGEAVGWPGGTPPGKWTIGAAGAWGFGGACSPSIGSKGWLVQPCCRS